MTAMTRSPMSMRMIALAVVTACLLLSACGKQADAPAAGNPVSAQDALPKACEDYINRVKGCVAKRQGDQAAQQFQQSLDQMRAQWAEAADKTALVPACEQANAAFNQMAQQLQCE